MGLLGTLGSLGGGIAGAIFGGPAGAGIGASLGGSIFGGIDQDQTNARNMRAAQQRYNQIQGMVTGQMLPQQNPYAQQLSQMFAGQQMQQWSPYAAQSYDPSMAQGPSLGAAPQIQAPGALSFLTVNGPGSAGQNGPVNPGQVNAQQISPDFSAQQIGAPQQVGVPLIQGPQMGGQFNAGQDALMQMLRRGPQQQRDNALQSSLQQLYNPAAYDVSGIMQAQQPIQDAGLNQQVSALRGSAGSLGQRFGSDMRNSEALLRSSVQNQTNLNNQNLLQSSYNQAQANRLQALGLGQQGLQNANQFNLSSAGLRQQAAGQLSGNAFQQAQLGQQAQTQNASNILQAQGINVNAALQAAQANQGAGLQAQGQTLQALLANQSTGLQASQLNAGNQLQALLAFQNLGQQNNQFNSSQALQAALANQSMQAQTGQFNNSQALQAALANQSMMGQFGLQQGGFDLQTALANAAAQNQGQQFNIGQNFQAAGLNANQMNIMNQLLMSGLGQANQMQQGTAQTNAGLLGILAGQQYPQAQPSAIPGAVGDMGQLMMLLPFLNGGNRSSGASLAPANTPQFTLPTGLQSLFGNVH